MTLFDQRDDVDENRVVGIFWKCARVGERLSPYVSICCFLMAVSFMCPQNGMILTRQ